MSNNFAKTYKTQQCRFDSNGGKCKRITDQKSYKCIGFHKNHDDRRRVLTINNKNEYNYESILACDSWYTTGKCVLGDKCSRLHIKENFRNEFTYHDDIYKSDKCSKDNCNEACRYYHQNENKSTKQITVKNSARNLMFKGCDYIEKNKIPDNYKVNPCPNGELCLRRMFCMYYHNENERRTCLDIGNKDYGSAINLYNKTEIAYSKHSYKKKQCEFIKYNNCWYGPVCKNLHEEDENEKVYVKYKGSTPLVVTNAVTSAAATVSAPIPNYWTSKKNNTLPIIKSPETCNCDKYSALPTYSSLFISDDKLIFKSADKLDKTNQTDDKLWNSRLFEDYNTPSKNEMSPSIMQLFNDVMINDNTQSQESIQKNEVTTTENIINSPAPLTPNYNIGMYQYGMPRINVNPNMQSFPQVYEQYPQYHQYPLYPQYGLYKQQGNNLPICQFPNNCEIHD